ncbi:bifunctional methylenetetrahydrofolate dehydrogenase/methenyltetrahydrofolate cyclohydrolase FolD [Paenactinomyces guangxiensis]|uniref:Bifunctional protein FolD n=1 Tax=Paenactinomyces guangxiensis TaxID=1490290 RepID=A0A7W1WS80_9BACL|nr:bifunctional methylenetetrahydrofolate dehydrogenase/methenyltetrahydrofolate cyclohydrolase FolD [Paenactinomyces guangxiensis]MBA4494998.1 bifunctional methylenetetrahydrofolate dehydrogenase/methenyltetrahydrofolate cyclohydrolase FolD [Paenactinomyces guangxiensis]MBH8592081.1 bifunctional methylenetetrahydrofolate dehydrogenase/methenyltetrahydrofolate cyclohydrolase FolD [Paenactinomyces guangxiensis]
MPYHMIDGKAIAQQVRNELKEEVGRLKEQGIIPGLRVILVGTHPASESYVRGKIRASEEVGINSELIRLNEEVSEAELLQKVTECNKDPAVHGILVQLPLPLQIDTNKVIATISPEKDVDGFTPVNVGNLIIGQDAFFPCTPYGIMELLKRSDISVEGKHAVVVGRSNIVGKPISFLLQQANATVTMCHSRTVDLPFYTKQADILIAAVGRTEMITSEHVKPGAVVIDVGINRKEDGKLAGDVLFADVAPLTSAITPVPGGVGPMTIAMLLKNTVQSAIRKESKR